MIRALFTLLILAGVSHQACAGWFSDEATDESLEYCTGLIVSGLESKQVAGASRTSLWLAWSHIIRAGALDGDRGSAAISNGREQFSDALDAATIQSNLDSADGSCGLGRSNLQISGW